MSTFHNSCRGQSIPATWILGLMLAVVVGCGRSAPKPTPEPTPTAAPTSGAIAATRPPAPTTEEVSVVDQIKKQLFTNSDIELGADITVETFAADADHLQLLVRGEGNYLCSPTGNCPSWIFRKTATGYEKEADLGSAQTVRIEGDNLKYAEVVARQHGSAWESDVRVYRFDGTEYRLAKCPRVIAIRTTDHHWISRSSRNFNASLTGSTNSNQCVLPDALNRSTMPSGSLNESSTIPSTRLPGEWNRSPRIAQRE